ncbi:MAG: hypothetical protein AB7V77_05420 [Candidatus Woesearchaeota archaeon]
MDLNIPPPQQSPQNSMAMPQGMDTTTNEELIEAIIDEKWNQLIKDINKIIEWKNITEVKVAKMEQQFSDLRKNFDDLHAAVVGKLGEYDKHILDVGAEIQSMEKVFAKVLPVFTQNVSELSRITDDLKGKQSKPVEKTK